VADDTELRASIAEELGSDADLIRELARPVLPILAAGTVVADQFEIEGLLGRGGMGAVYRARDRVLGRRVALKIGPRDTDVTRLEREASALARLAHPNVVTIYEIGTHEGAPFVVMELCGGGTARAWLAERRPWRAVVEMFVAAGRGLAAAHAAGIVHGDIKPDNILLGDDGRPRIADFGLARETLDPARDRSGGTPRYMAPELARGAATAASDQFAFAVALYEALSGLDPFPRDPVARVAAIERGRLAVPAGVPRRIIVALARAMDASPDARWPHVATLLDRLQPSRRRWMLVPFLAVGVTVIATGAWRLSEEATEARLGVQPSRCEGLPVDLATDWNAAERTRIAAAHPRGRGAATLFVDVLDAFVAEWAIARRRLCKELPTLASWSPSLGDAGRTCLLARRSDLRRLTARRDLDPGELLGIVHAMLLPSTCADPARLEPKTLDPEIASVRILSEAIAQQANEGQADQALARAKALVEGLPPNAPPLAVGMANAILGELLLAQAGIGESAGPTRTAFFAYRVAGSPQAFEPALRLVDGYTQAGELALAEEWLAHSRAEANRIEVSAGNRSALDLIGARLLAQRGNNEAALAEARRTLDRLAASTDPRRALMTLAIQTSIAVFLAELGRFDESVSVARETTSQREHLYGPDHPILIHDLFSVGLGELDVGRHAEALVALRRAREIADASLPEGAVLRGYALWNEALALGRSDRRAARPLFDRALAILVAAQGADSSDAAELRADRTRWSDE
jgi:aminoglycoside phosphotransferase (APT) family kinase protein/tetratricopeptide (TPR) repeat protein